MNVEIMLDGFIAFHELTNENYQRYVRTVGITYLMNDLSSRFLGHPNTKYPYVMEHTHTENILTPFTVCEIPDTYAIISFNNPYMAIMASKKIHLNYENFNETMEKVQTLLEYYERVTQECCTDENVDHYRSCAFKLYILRQYFHNMPQMINLRGSSVKSVTPHPQDTIKQVFSDMLVTLAEFLKSRDVTVYRIHAGELVVSGVEAQVAMPDLVQFFVHTYGSHHEINTNITKPVLHLIGFDD